MNSRSSQDAEAQSASAKNQSATTNEWIVWTWAGWEPVQFYRRIGGFHEEQEGNGHGLEAWSAKLRSPQAAQALRDASVNWVTTHFFKGFGLKTEAEEIAQTAELIRNYHAEGIRVFSYIQYGTIMPETLFAEEPEAEEWQRVDWHNHHDGPPYEYGEQYWRVKPCASHDGFLQYLLRCVDKAIEIGSDGIWIDNLNSDGCHCDACQKAFRKYLAETVKDPWREMGLPDLTNVDIPRVERPRDPLFQAWIRFRARESKNAIERIARHARERKPGIVVAANFGLDSHMRNLAEGGKWVGDYGTLDVIYAENQSCPGWEQGKIVSQHRSMKLSESIGVKVVPGAGSKMRRVGPYEVSTVPDRRQLRRVCAESLLFGAGITNGPWGLRGGNAGEDPIYLRDAEARKNSRELADEYRALHQTLAGSVDATPVAILYSFEAMAYDDAASMQALTAISQLLLQHQIPFRYVLSDHPENLEGVRLLILPHVLGISDDLASTLKAYSNKGGRILATGRSSLYDESLRMRLDYALADVFGVHFSSPFEAENQHAILVNEATGSILLPGEWGLTDADGKPFCAVSGDRIVAAIRQALGNGILPNVLCPLPHVGFEMRRLPNGSYLLGLLNYSDEPVSAIRITLPGKLAGTVAPLGTAAAAVHQTCEETAVVIPHLDVEMFLMLTPFSR